MNNRKPTAPKFTPRVGTMLNLAGQVWQITQIKTRGRWQAAFKGTDPSFKPETGTGLNFGEPGVVQLIYQAKRRRFWAKPYHVRGSAGNNGTGQLKQEEDNASRTADKEHEWRNGKRGAIRHGSVHGTERMRQEHPA